MPLTFCRHLIIAEAKCYLEKIATPLWQVGFVGKIDVVLPKGRYKESICVHVATIKPTLSTCHHAVHRQPRRG